MNFLGAAAGHEGLGLEEVADGQVAFHAQAGHVEGSGIGAGIAKEVVAGGTRRHPEGPGWCQMVVQLLSMASSRMSRSDRARLPRW